MPIFQNKPKAGNILAGQPQLSHLGLSDIGVKTHVELDKLANTPTRTTSASATTLVLPRFLRGLGMPTTPGGIILP